MGWFNSCASMVGLTLLSVPQHKWLASSASKHMRHFCCSMGLEQTDIRVSLTEATSSSRYFFKQRRITPQCFHAYINVAIKDAFFCKVKRNHTTDVVHNCTFVLELLAHTDANS
jgi:hypothetical protein